MIAADAFRDQPALHGATVRLEPLTLAVFEDYVRALHDPEVDRSAGTHVTHTRSQIEAWLRTRHDHNDRADWAIIRAADGEFLGEAVINDLDPDNESAGYRIWLAGPDVFGRGYGTEATRLFVDYALHQIGLHRLSLEAFDHNPRARRVYEKRGFILEGRMRDALLWDGERHDTLVMAILNTGRQPDA